MEKKKKAWIDRAGESFVSGAGRLGQGLGQGVRDIYKGYTEYSKKQKKTRLKRIKEENEILRAQVEKERLREKLRGKNKGTGLIQW